jgi:hypothetical protein
MAQTQDVRLLEMRINDLERRVQALEAKLSPLGNGETGAPIDTRKEMRENRDELLKEINKWAALAYQHRTYPTSRGGGGGSYLGFIIPKELTTTTEGTISVTVATDSLVLTVESAKGYGSVTVAIGPDGRFISGSLVFTGEFAKPTD